MDGDAGGSGLSTVIVTSDNAYGSRDFFFFGLPQRFVQEKKIESKINKLLTTYDSPSTHADKKIRRKSRRGATCTFARNTTRRHLPSTKISPLTPFVSSRLS